LILMIYKAFKISMLVILLSFSFLHCSKEDPSENATRLRIKLTDAASLVVKELHIDIQRIEVLVADTTGSEGEWETLQFTGGEYDLLKLMNGRNVQLVDQYFPAGGILQKIKLILGNNNRLLTTTDSIVSLNIPSEMTDGIIIDNVNAALPANIITSVVIDVNAALSVRESNGNYFLHPSARAFPETFGGSLRGYVAPIEAEAFVAIVQERDTFLTLPEAEGGMFLFTGLNPGAWEVHIISNPLSNFRDTIFTDSVEQGKITEITPKPIQLIPIMP